MTRRCTAADPASRYLCDLPDGHDGQHIGGAHAWVGTCADAEDENAVLTVCLDGPARPLEIMALTGLSRRDVMCHLAALEAAGLIHKDGPRWHG